jgi:hypothetical protein
MLRSLEVLIDSKTWPNAKVPAEIVSLGGARKVDVLLALIYTALCTRPPEVYGFHLSDLWACFRYVPAISDSPDLRLRREWERVDPHQKTLLSDELGVGFTTSLLATELGWLDFADALYVARFLEPKNFSLIGSAKRGPKKSPDYIGRDGASKRYVVLECKGTQSSRAELNAAIQRGRVQKKTLKARKPKRIKHSLVGGLFIPQFNNADSSCIVFGDPSWGDLERICAGRPHRVIDRAIVQVALAKNLALIGFGNTASIVATIEAAALRELPRSARAELGASRRGLDGGLALVFDNAVVRGAVAPLADHDWRFRFLASAPEELMVSLANIESFSDYLDQIVTESQDAEWQNISGDNFAEVHTPLGFKLRLERV